MPISEKIRGKFPKFVEIANYSISMAFDLDLIQSVYQRMPERVAAARQLLGRPLTLTEKILYSHLWDNAAPQSFGRGKD